MKKIVFVFCAFAFLSTGCASAKKTAKMENELAQQKNDIAEIKEDVKKTNNLLWEMSSKPAPQPQSIPSNDQSDQIKQMEIENLKRELDRKNEEIQQARNNDINEKLSSLNDKIDKMEKAKEENKDSCESSCTSNSCEAKKPVCRKLPSSNPSDRKFDSIQVRKPPREMPKPVPPPQKKKREPNCFCK